MYKRKQLEKKSSTFYIILKIIMLSVQLCDKHREY